MCIYISRDAYLITQNVLELRMNLSTAKKRHLREGSLSVPWTRASFRPIPNWNAQGLSTPTLQMLRAVSFRHLYGADLAFNAITSEHERPVSFIVGCPICGTLRQAAHIKMARGSNWNTIACVGELCGKKTSSAKWLCPCGKRWHICPRHSRLGYCCGLPKLAEGSPHAAGRKRSSSRALPATDLLLPTSSLKQRRKVGADNMASLPSKKRPATTTAVPWFSKAPKLSPGLFAKFPHLLREYSQNQATPFHDPTASSSSAPRRQQDPG